MIDPATLAVSVVASTVVSVAVSNYYAQWRLQSADGGAVISDTSDTDPREQ